MMVRAVVQVTSRRPLRVASRRSPQLCLLAACSSLAPETPEPALDLPAAWPADSRAGRRRRRAAASDWWTMFGDPTLDRLVDRGAPEQPRRGARHRPGRGGPRPGGAGAGGPVAGRAGARRRGPGTRLGALGEPAAAGHPPIGDSRSIGIEASYEADFWGRYRDASVSARAALAASRYAQAVVRLSVATQVVQGYFDLRALDAQLDLTRRTLRTRNETVGLREKRLKGGTGSALDLQQDQAEAAAAEATLAELSERASLTESALSVLLGRSPRELFVRRDRARRDASTHWPRRRRCRPGCRRSCWRAGPTCRSLMRCWRPRPPTSAWRVQATCRRWR